MAVCILLLKISIDISVFLWLLTIRILTTVIIFIGENKHNGEHVECNKY